MARWIPSVLAASLVLASPAASQETGTAPGLLDGGTDALQPGDVVRLRVWREEELSGEFPVQEDGNVVLPRLGAWPAAGRTPAELKREVTEAYSEILRNPAIEIVVLRRINILGEVRQPGIYPVDPTMTVTEALALAGGPLETADRSRLILIRGGREIEIELDRPYSAVDIALRSGDRLYVPSRNWIVRNWPIFATLVSTSISLVIALTR